MATIEIDGKTLDVENGKMIIEVADEAGIYIPRFCYHKKLSVAANCRMCLVEVEKNRKTVPACATPISDGMKVFTKSPEAVKSQKAVMDFLLINHPLDCPICDQGGECELQDLSMGYGEDSSTYKETKRSVKGDNLGSLIETEMTRCIHCTRCVRFGDEVAGVRELGAMGRGEHVEIGTYVQHSMQSEISGNIIDLCPVGALTSKPFRYKARSWEMTQTNGIAVHDCLGSHVHYHSLRGQVLRVVPRECEQINETWLSDRDRFSYLGIHHTQRAMKPWIKRQSHWEEVDWQTALTFAAQKLNHIINLHGPEQVAAFASSSSSTEACYLLQKWMRTLGVNNIDYRLQQSDFRDQAQQAVIPNSTLPYLALDQQNTVVIVGCHLNKEVPLAAARVRKAFLNGANVYALNPVDFEFTFELADRWISSPQDMINQLAIVLASVIDNRDTLPIETQKIILGLAPDERSIKLAKQLREPNAVLVTGALCENHPQAAFLRTLIGLISEKTGARILRLTTGANSAGAALAGVLPHRTVGGRGVDNPGLTVAEALEAGLKAYVLLDVEPSFDFASPNCARQAMIASECVIVISPFADESIREYADIILPMASYAESSGTYLNVDGSWQTMKGVIPPVGESRPAWKILRVLANICHSPGFDYTSSEEVLNEIRSEIPQDLSLSSSRGYFYPDALPISSEPLLRVGEWPMYRTDSVVRRSEALQISAGGVKACVRIHPETAQRLNLSSVATVSQGEIEITLSLEIDDRVAKDVVWVPNALPETADLGSSFGKITIKQVNNVA
jgi:NADH-quinone oxidoreductase subunit G